MNKSLSEVYDTEFCRSLLGLVENHVVLFMVSIITDIVLLNFERVLLLEVLETFLETGDILSRIKPRAKN